MANTKSAEKAARQAEKHRAHNVTLRSRMRTAIRKVNDAVAKGSKDEAHSSYRAAVPVIDTLVNKRIIHRNQADRHKSRLAARVKSVGAATLSLAAGGARRRAPLVVLQRQQQRQARIATRHLAPVPALRPWLQRTGQRPQHIE